MHSARAVPSKTSQKLLSVAFRAREFQISPVPIRPEIQSARDEFGIIVQTDCARNTMRTHYPIQCRDDLRAGVAETHVDGRRELRERVYDR
jgi:hypothetical protein